MELSLGEMLMIVLVIVVLFGPDKIPEIARGLGQGVRKMRGAMEDIKTDIMKETDNPVSDIKREIDRIRSEASEFNPLAELKKDITDDSSPRGLIDEPKPVSLIDDETHEGPVSR
ncbi:Sec-independent protein translocase subunit TatA/TatB [Halpernia frigidisoli]|uniref:Sec-independent protein translocase protein TatA n=1 Tax=Halpernia frigidisoli TaxID=1125876 RepID=A0A1I3F5H3_9FLAO|nr:twin-arginine translocase TatA/TatE family subunit [Halpernia frigidisoli]SFI06468.1 sec-independent protein translocase protein TatB [Halpernia frigidisoli]